MFKSSATINAGGETWLTRAWGLWEHWEPKCARGCAGPGFGGGKTEVLWTPLFLGAINTEKSGLCGRFR